MNVLLGFAGSRRETIDALASLGALRCGYALGSEPTAWRTTRCDCKYGGPNPRDPHGVADEQTCCPELRTAVAVLEQMPDEHFDVLVAQAGGITRGERKG